MEPRNRIYNQIKDYINKATPITESVKYSIPSVLDLKTPPEFYIYHATNDKLERMKEYKNWFRYTGWFENLTIPNSLLFHPSAQFRNCCFEVCSPAMFACVREKLERSPKVSGTIFENLVTPIPIWETVLATLKILKRQARNEILFAIDQTFKEHVILPNAYFIEEITEYWTPTYMTLWSSEEEFKETLAERCISMENCEELFETYVKDLKLNGLF